MKGIRILYIDTVNEYHEVFNSILSFSTYVLNTWILVMNDYHDPEFPIVKKAALDFS